MPINPITTVLDLGGKILDKFVKDKDADAEREFRLALAQLQINMMEAQHPSVFVAGWRPYIGWVCGIALTFHFLLYPFVKMWYPAFPSIDFHQLYPIVAAMLGCSALRTYEKLKGVARNK